ncbi:outer membrane protein assembly factor BamB family protein [Halomicrococcus gelatinilyticus]|uniref:outer membrane protein assembly factor BamB family protein n=1 Tax=Halomicrococcus gelatinilyticus TaxID=1702103 RepID=UPI002E15C606
MESPPRSSSSQSDSSRRRTSRRALLATAGTATASALAGCNGVLGSSEDAAAFHDGDWRQYGNGPANANSVGGGAPKPDEHEWLTSAGWPYAPPVVHDGVAYFATEERVVAVTTDGSEQWSRQLDDGTSGAPAVDPDRGRLYVPTWGVRTTNGSDSERAFVTVLSLDDGDVVDTHAVGGRRTYGATVVDGDAYVRSATACVRLAPDGTERWRRPLDTLVYDEYNLGDRTATQVAPAVVEDAVYVTGRDAIVKLDRETGKERWRVPVDTAYAAPVVDDGGVVQTGWQETVAVDHAGEVRWQRDLHTIAAAAVADGDVYVAADDLYEIDAATGETNWQTFLGRGGTATAAPVVTDDAVLVVDSSVLAFRRDAGGLFGPERDLWQSSSVHTSALSSPVVAAGRVFVVGPRGLLALRAGVDG